MQTLLQDIRYGARMLARRPAFTIVALLTLALGVGVNTAIFSVVNGVLLRSLPFHQADQLTSVFITVPARAVTTNPASHPNFSDWRSQNSVFESMTAYSPATATFTGGGAPEQIDGIAGSPDLFAMLKTPPLLGRVFSSADEESSSKDLVISHALWLRIFNGDPNVVGRAVNLDTTAYTVIGVMPRGFRFPLNQSKSDYWLLLDARTDLNRERGANYLNVVARLKPGVTLEQAQAEMTTIAGRLEQSYPDKNAGRGINLVPLREALVGKSRRGLVVLLAAVGLVLLIACSNVANLQLARASSRARELAIRTALGAGRGRILRQLLTESVLLAMAGGAVGLLLAVWGVDLVVTSMPDEIPRAAEIRLDTRVLAFTAAITLLAGLASGLAPALQSSKFQLTDSLKEGGRASSDGARRTRSLLVVIEVALSLVLLIGAGLLIKSFRQLLEVNPGFNSSGVLTAAVALPGATYREEARQSAFFEQALNRISTLPGVAAVAVVDPVPMGGSVAMNRFTIEGQPGTVTGERAVTNSRTISADYFNTMRIPLVRGRTLSEHDRPDSPKVMVVNDTFARRHFPNEDPIGKRIRLTIAANFVAEIVGIVGDVKHQGLVREAGAEAYVSYLQVPTSIMTLVVRARPGVGSGNSTDLANAVRQAVLEVDKNQPLYDVKPMAAWLNDSVARERFNMLLLGVFAAVALVLAAIGIYGVINYTVSQRTREIGIRLALGAQRQDVLRLVVGQGSVLILTGIGCGLLAAFALTRVMKGLLFEVSPSDPATFALISVSLAAIGLLACYFPARRAASTDPVVALRYD